MSNEQSNITDFNINLICEYFSNVQRQGPGSPEATRQAYAFLDHLPEFPRIADIGCGTGGQTMVLASLTSGHITGMDLFPRFIELFQQNAAHLGLQDRVQGVVASMEQLPFEPNSLDLIWCEGAIYNIGFQRGLAEWKPFLKDGGYLAVTEASWFTPQRPAEIHDFWMDAYPEMDTIPNKVAQMQQAGYVPVATFIIPETCWTDHFFAPQVPAQELFLKKYAGVKAAEDLVAYMRHEARLYAQYKEYYGYVFYIGKKI
jgi:SAM-dependent methyltransferase